MLRAVTPFGGLSVLLEFFWGESAWSSSSRTDSSINLQVPSFPVAALTRLRVTLDNSPTTAQITGDDRRGATEPNQGATPVDPLDAILSGRLSGRLCNRTGDAQDCRRTQRPCASGSIESGATAPGLRAWRSIPEPRRASVSASITDKAPAGMISPRYFARAASSS